ncbi:hypothetical protein AKJ16_DCAP14525 [Drosera capensis]
MGSYRLCTDVDEPEEAASPGFSSVDEAESPSSTNKFTNTRILIIVVGLSAMILMALCVAASVAGPIMPFNPFYMLIIIED